MRSLLAAIVTGVLAVGTSGALAAKAAPTPEPSARPKRPSLAEAVAKLKIPPQWFKTTAVNWDVNRPWKEGRIQIRKLLAQGGSKAREGMKLTWLYATKRDIGDGHELPMYMFISGNYAWATRQYPKYLAKVKGKGATHGYLGYSSCLAHFGEYDRALKVLDQADKDLAKPPWRIGRRAAIHDARGDIYAAAGKVDLAKKHYARAIRLLPTSKQPHGRHLLRRKTQKIQTKLDLLTMKSLADARLRDGTYSARTLGYAKDIVVTVTVRGGRIADVKVKHQEKIDLDSTKIIPRRIVAGNTLKVDAVTGATITSQAIVDGAFRALKQAGLE